MATLTKLLGTKTARYNVALSVVNEVLLHRREEARFGNNNQQIQFTTLTNGLLVLYYLDSEYTKIIDKYFTQDKMTITVRDKYQVSDKDMAAAKMQRSKAEAKGKAKQGMKPQAAFVKYIFEEALKRGTMCCDFVVLVSGK